VSSLVRPTAAEGYAFFQGLDVASNGRADLAYQALKTADSSTFGTGNAWIDTWYTNRSAGASGWSAPIKVSSAHSDPAASAQDNLARQFFGDYKPWSRPTPRSGSSTPIPEPVLAAQPSIGINAPSLVPASCGGIWPTG
jgi:hypothetical protein